MLNLKTYILFFLFRNYFINVIQYTFWIQEHLVLKINVLLYRSKFLILIVPLFYSCIITYCYTFNISRKREMFKIFHVFFWPSRRSGYVNFWNSGDFMYVYIYMYLSICVYVTDHVYKMTSLKSKMGHIKLFLKTYVLGFTSDIFYFEGRNFSVTETDCLITCVHVSG